MNNLVLSDKEFAQFRDLIFEIAGIRMSDAKKPLVSGRLAKRIRQQGLFSYGDYFRLLLSERTELQVAVDLLTTNETYFFREPKHFDFLRERILPELASRSTLRIWSGACSSGEEPYSIAMTLADVLGNRPWEVLASDLSLRVLEKARGGLYRMVDAEDIPRPLLARYCLKGVGENAGSLLIEPALRNRMTFRQVNLNATLPDLGQFEVIFLRNVMIYFDLETKRQVMQRLLPLLRPGGYFIVSHSESLNGVCDGLKVVSPSIYRKPHG
ncbi:protein-glutamate O-methyltransferase CheR [Pseudomonas sp. B21-056]|uniref:CheR family methyltransferase n=1 Tax=Pseudomonas sp. B21-056 TaxID=2895495 RepID=UPI002231FEC6|nr:protein-glutamate O-methyltransferase CheR [Pseudomonas sp. B21-056]UZE21513.1 protein-glutamate O-methyltransferase CheR [Pseudomonas sp. B21-056]